MPAAVYPELPLPASLGYDDRAMGRDGRALEGQRALVTGGGRGIGAAVAQRLAREGVRVILASRTRADLERVAQETGGECHVCDLAVADQVEDLARKAGPVEILVNNAGIAESAPLGRTGLDLWRRTMDTNVTSAFLLSKAIVPGMAERNYGRIVNVASIAGKRGAPYISAYAASKHALLGLTSSLAMEFAETGILVNAVCPRYVDTPMTSKNVDFVARRTGRPPGEVLGSFLSSFGQQRLLHPDTVAEVVLALARPECSHTGAAIDL